MAFIYAYSFVNIKDPRICESIQGLLLYPSIYLIKASNFRAWNFTIGFHFFCVCVRHSNLLSILHRISPGIWRKIKVSLTNCYFFPSWRKINNLEKYEMRLWVQNLGRNIAILNLFPQSYLNWITFFLT